MKKLFLLRHAKSSWDDPGLSDYERPLAPRGLRATRRLARHIEERGLSFDQIVCSSAVRAASTWQQIASALRDKTPVSYEEGIYMSGDDGLMTRLRALPDNAETVLLVGHNPDMEWLAHRLCKGGEPQALERLRGKYPTGGFAEIELDCDRWSDLADGCGQLRNFIVPRELPDD